jgi:DNA polymerase-3 subunit epsilon
MSRVIDTLALARRKHPAGPNSLDALCKRYGVDNSKRTKHGALMDSLLLADVYVELLGERQATLGLAQSTAGKNGTTRNAGGTQRKALQRPSALAPRLTDELEVAHRAFVETLGATAIWRQFYPAPPAETDKGS